MRVLIGCEYSGIVRDAFIAKGHDAMSCDLLPTESPGPHYQGSILDVLGDGWDLMIAHPPCTYLSNAGARHLYKGGMGQVNAERLEMGIEGLNLFLAIYNAPIKKICIENPIPSRVYYEHGMPHYNQIIQPYEHGHPYKKKTCLWLKGLPPLMATEIVSVAESTRKAGNWFNAGGKHRQKNRAKTFSGIAKAMAEQWGSL